MIMTSKILQIRGMSCEHCTAAVTRAVGGLPGVRSVEVSLEAGTAAVDFDEKRLSLETIKRAIADQGYELP